MVQVLWLGFRDLGGGVRFSGGTKDPSGVM